MGEIMARRSIARPKAADLGRTAPIAGRAVRTANRVNVSKPPSPSATDEYTGTLPEVVAIMRENARLRSEVVRLRGQVASLMIASRG